MTTLFKSQSVAEGEFDSKRLSAEALQHQYEAARADLAKLLDEAEKKKIKAPYGGVVIDTPVTRGEWISTGDTVVVTARDDSFDVVVNAPREAFGVVKPGLKVGVGAAGAEIPGEVFAVIPRGDVATPHLPGQDPRAQNNGDPRPGHAGQGPIPARGRRGRHDRHRARATPWSIPCAAEPRWSSWPCWRARPR